MKNAIRIYHVSQINVTSKIEQDLIAHVRRIYGSTGNLVIPNVYFLSVFFLFSSMMDHQRGSCNEIKFRQKRFFVGEFQRKTQKRRVFVIKRSIERFVANKWDICEKKFPSNSSQSFIKLQCSQIYKRLIEARMHPVDNVYFSREIRYYETLYDRVQQRSMTSLIKSVLPTCSRFLWNIYRIK